MKLVLIPLFVIAGIVSSMAMTGCVVHDRDRVVYDRDHPGYYHDDVHHEVVQEHHDDVVHVDVRP